MVEGRKEGKREGLGAPNACSVVTPLLIIEFCN